MTAPLVRVQNLTRTISLPDRDLTLLRNVTFDIHHGDRICIVGRSGSGKSSLLELLGQLSASRPGTLFFEGLDTASLGLRARSILRRTRIGFVFQGFHLIDHMSAIDNVALPLRYAGQPRRAALAKAAARLTDMGLGHRLTARSSQLSGGERQRVAIARATVADPDLVLADEPTGSLDVETGEAVMSDLLGDRADRRRALVMVTHNPDFAKRFDRQFLLHGGELKSQ